MGSGAEVVLLSGLHNSFHLDVAVPVGTVVLLLIVVIVVLPAAAVGVGDPGDGNLARVHGGHPVVTADEIISVKK